MVQIFPQRDELIAWSILSLVIGAVILWAALLRYWFEIRSVWVFHDTFLTVNFAPAISFFVLSRIVGVNPQFIISIEYFVTTVIISAVAAGLGIMFGQRLISTA